MDENYIKTALSMIMDKLGIPSEEFEKMLEFNKPKDNKELIGNEVSKNPSGIKEQAKKALKGKTFEKRGEELKKQGDKLRKKAEEVLGESKRLFS